MAAKTLFILLQLRINICLGISIYRELKICSFENIALFIVYGSIFKIKSWPEAKL